METFGINHERISDYGCKKLLGLNVPVSAYINGYSIRDLKNDSFTSSKKQDKALSVATKAVGILCGISAAMLAISSIIKKKKAPENIVNNSDKIKTTIFSGLKKLFTKNKA